MYAAANPESKAVVLVVDDEPTVREMIAINLQREGLTVVLASSGAMAIDQTRAINPDLVVLDVMLPGLDGFEVCRRIREQSTVPILLLSARAEEIDRVVGLEIGADDYLTKPFAMRELVARVRAMLRRARMMTSTGAGVDASATLAERAPEGSGRLTVVGDVQIDSSRREAVVAGEPVTLKSKEFDLLLYLARHPGIVLTRDALLREVWGYNYPVDTRTVDVHIRWLRQKIEDDPANPRRLLTVRGHGYRFVEPDGQ